MADNQADSIDAQILVFWQWFARNASRIAELYSRKNFSDLSETINQEIDKIEPELAWEIGPGQHKSYLLTVSSEGNPKFRPIAEKMIRLAPELSEWEFYSSRPARQPAARVRLPERDMQFDASLWKFVPLERPEKGRLDLLVLDEQLARSDREASLTAVSIYLDQILGEDTVERWIGKLDVENPGIARHGRVYDISEVSDYLYWATHREANPLKSH